MKGKRKKEKLLKATYSPLWVALGQYHQASSHKNHQNTRLGVYSQPDKWGDWLQEEPPIAFERVSKPNLSVYVRRDKFMKVSISP